MRKLFVFVVTANVLSLFAVYAFESMTGYLHIQFASDYAFYAMLLLLSLGAIFSFSGHKVGYSDPSNVAGVAASSLIDNASAKTTKVTKLEGTGLGQRLLLASLLPLAFCIFA